MNPALSEDNGKTELSRNFHDSNVGDIATTSVASIPGGEGQRIIANLLAEVSHEKSAEVKSEVCDDGDCCGFV